MRIPRPALGALLLGWTCAPAALAHPGQGIPNPQYPDGTGDVAVDALNAGQLDQNYRGPFYAMPPRAPGPPAYGPPAYGPPPGDASPPGYGRPGYGPPGYGPPGYGPPGTRPPSPPPPGW